jgi:hypothetical protein
MAVDIDKHEMMLAGEVPGGFLTRKTGGQGNLFS